MYEIKLGTVEGTGAAINVEIGFIPDYVEVYNYDDADGKAPVLEWWNGMTDGHGLKRLGVVDSGATGDKSQAKITTGGISKYQGTAGSKALGFTIGTDTDINVNGETLFYRAVRGG